MVWIVRLLAAFGLAHLIDAISEVTPKAVLSWRDKCAMTACSFALALLMTGALLLIVWALA